MMNAAENKHPHDPTRVHPGRGGLPPRPHGRLPPWPSVQKRDRKCSRPRPRDAPPSGSPMPLPWGTFPPPRHVATRPCGSSSPPVPVEQVGAAQHLGDSRVSCGTRGGVPDPSSRDRSRPRRHARVEDDRVWRVMSCNLRVTRVFREPARRSARSRQPSPGRRHRPWTVPSRTTCCRIARRSSLRRAYAPNT